MPERPSNQSNFVNLLYRSTDEELPNDSVAAAVYVDDEGNIVHSALVVSYNADSKLFHYTGRDVKYEEVDLDDIYYCKTLNFLEPILLPSYVAHCELIHENSEPQYGYFYTGSYYHNGVFKSSGDLPEYMTCVGFCLNVIKTFLSGEQDFIIYDDWDEQTLQRGDLYLNEFLLKVKERNPNVKLADFRKNIRRIWPVEYLTGAYANEIPVSKVFVDENVADVRMAILMNHAG